MDIVFGTSVFALTHGLTQFHFLPHNTCKHAYIVHICPISANHHALTQFRLGMLLKCVHVLWTLALSAHRSNRSNSMTSHAPIADWTRCAHLLQWPHGQHLRVLHSLHFSLRLGARKHAYTPMSTHFMLTCARSS